MVSIRSATADDLVQMQNANLWCLPENYDMKYYYIHLTTWPPLLHVAEDHNGKLIGYVLAKLGDDPGIPNGHITSIAVLRTHRKKGVATKLMEAAHRAMVESFHAEYVSLHVRVSNVAAIHLYHKTLGYSIYEVENGYYGDGEDAFDMRKPFTEKSKRAFASKFDKFDAILRD